MMHPVRHWLQEVIAHLEDGDDPHGVGAELLDVARGLLTESPERVATLFVADAEELARDIADRPGERAAVLAEHVEAIAREVAEAGDGAGQMLAERLYNAVMDR